MTSKLTESGESQVIEEIWPSIPYKYQSGSNPRIPLILEKMAKEKTSKDVNICKNMAIRQLNEIRSNLFSALSDHQKRTSEKSKGTSMSKIESSKVHFSTSSFSTNPAPQNYSTPKFSAQNTRPAPCKKFSTIVVSDSSRKKKILKLAEELQEHVTEYYSLSEGENDHAEKQDRNSTVPQREDENQEGLTAENPQEFQNHSQDPQNLTPVDPQMSQNFSQMTQNEQNIDKSGQNKLENSLNMTQTKKDTKLGGKQAKIYSK